MKNKWDIFSIILGILFSAIIIIIILCLGVIIYCTSTNDKEFCESSYNEIVIFPIIFPFEH